MPLAAHLALAVAAKPSYNREATNRRKVPAERHAMDILLKALAGAAVTALVSYLAKKGSVLPGIVPLFPTFGLIALYLVGTEGDTAGFRQACVASAKTIPAYLVFLGVCYLASTRLGFRSAMLLGLAGWMVAVAAAFALPRLL